MSGGMGGGEAGIDPPTTTKGDISGFDTTFDRIPIGADTQVLTADSTQGLGLKWANAAAGGSSTLELLDFHEASGTESSYTFTPSSPLVMGNYTQVIIYYVLESSAGFALELLTNGDTANYYGNIIQINNAGTVSGSKYSALPQMTVASSTLNPSGNNVQGEIHINVPNRGAFGLDYMQMWFRAFGDASGIGETGFGQNLNGDTVSITEIKLETSASTWKDDSYIAVYGVKNA